MRLLNVKSMKLEEYFGEAIPRYAILSHCWGQSEVTFQDINGLLWEEKQEALKIKLSSNQAKKDDLEYVWIDTCCIDKSSSAELSEAINSMFAWYENAVVCYVYLEDVSVTHRLRQEDLCEFERVVEKSKWFTRGWTLQELIAPTTVRFFDDNWNSIGTKAGLLGLLSNVTAIPKDVLADPSATNSCSVANKMSWAAKRATTRVEDTAYCLLGLFNVNMPLLYGEGTKAFIRLQEAILKETDDHTLLAWELEVSPMKNSGEPDFVGVLAQSPRNFIASANVIPFVGHNSRDQPSMMTSRGLRMDVQLVSPGRIGDRKTRIALLNCHLKHDYSDILGLTLKHVAHNVYIRAPCCPGLELCRPALSTKHTIFVLKTPVQEFTGLGYHISSSSAEELGFRIVEVIPRNLSWNPTTRSLHFTPDQDYEVSLHFSNEKLEMGFLVTIHTQIYWLEDEYEDDVPRQWSLFKASAKGSKMDFEEWYRLSQWNGARNFGEWGVQRLRLVMHDSDKISAFEVDLSIGPQDGRRHDNVELKVEMIRKEKASSFFERLNPWAEQKEKNGNIET